MSKRFCVLFWLVGFGTTSCLPCANMDCLHNDYELDVRIVDEHDDTDLLFGPTRAFDKDKLELFGVNQDDTVHYEYSAVKTSGDGYDSILSLRIFPGNPSTVYLRLSDSDIDTIALAYRIYNSECCGLITEIKNFSYNNRYELPGKGIQQINK